MAKKAKAKSKTGTKKTADATVPLHIVVHFIRTLHKRKHAAKFLAHVRKSNVKIVVPGKEVDVINDFLRENSVAADAATEATVEGMKGKGMTAAGMTAKGIKGIDLCPGPDAWKCQD